MLDSSKLLPATCTSINGYMTAYLSSTTNRRHLSESQIYSAIQDYISKSYSSDSIVGVAYIPPSAAAEDATTTEGVVTGSRTANIFQDSSSTWEITPAFGLLALIVSLLAMVGLVHIVKQRSNQKSSTLSPSIAAMEPEVSNEITSEPPTPITKNTLRRLTSDETEECCSVVTEDYTPNEYTDDTFIKRMSTYGSAWGERMRTWQSSVLSVESGRMEEEKEEVNSLPSEMGEEVGMDDFM